jgi:hypothetical protein
MQAYLVDLPTRVGTVVTSIVIDDGGLTVDNDLVNGVRTHVSLGVEGSFSILVIIRFTDSADAVN